jgi:hypothetical protein
MDPLLGFLPTRSFPWKSAAEMWLNILGIVEHALQGLAEDFRDAESRIERRRILPQLDCVHRLTRELDLFGQLLLRHFPVLEAQPPDFVADRSHLIHRAGIGRSGSRSA